jgi:hypothetical protein
VQVVSRAMRSSLIPFLEMRFLKAPLSDVSPSSRINRTVTVRHMHAATAAAAPSLLSKGSARGEQAMCT